MTSNPANKRDALRRAIIERDAAKEMTRTATETADRSKQQVQSAETRLAAFGDVDDAILKHRAASFKAAAADKNSKPSLAIPADLVLKERARDEAAAALAAARAAHGSLVGELAEAQAALRKSEGAVSTIAAEVLAAEAAEQGSALNGLWSELWDLIDRLNAFSSAVGVRLPPEIVRVLQAYLSMDHRQFAGGSNPSAATYRTIWRARHAALCKNADATDADIFEGGVPVAAVERVA